MKNVERCGFSMALASSEYMFANNLPIVDLWGPGDYRRFCKWLTEESNPQSLKYTELVPDKPVNKIDHPKHYKHRSGLDAIVWIDRYKMDFSTGNCFKYLFRRGEKSGETLEEDEGKAKWYFEHEVSICAKRACSWVAARREVADVLIEAFGPPGKLEDGSPDWSVGGCDMPEVVEFIKREFKIDSERSYGKQ